jgi:hypothetical protein
MKHDDPTPTASTDPLPFAAGEGLANEPRLLSDLQLLGALHAELAGRPQGADARRSLFELGFLHGIRDSLRAASLLGDRARPGPDAGAVAPLLAIALDPRPRGTLRGEVHLLGRWPETHEATAHVARLGRSDGPACGLSAGYTAGWYSGLLERDLVAVERTCVACGDDSCRFELRDAAAWLERGDPQAGALLAELSFDTFRELAARAGDPAPGRTPASVPSAPPATTNEPPFVHVWGPVMVLPFAGVDEALRGLDLIGRDPAARAVSVVIVDLTDAVLDEAFGAATLEHVVAAVEGWGAEPILAGVSPQSEAAVADLVARHVIVHKDLPLAIAAAFQIARAQSRSV